MSRSSGRTEAFCQTLMNLWENGPHSAMLSRRSARFSQPCSSRQSALLAIRASALELAPPSRRQGALVRFGRSQLDRFIEKNAQEALP